MDLTKMIKNIVAVEPVDMFIHLFIYLFIYVPITIENLVKLSENFRNLKANPCLHKLNSKPLSL